MNLIDPTERRMIVALESGSDADPAGELAESIAAELDSDLIVQLMSEAPGPLRRDIRGAGTGLPPRPNRNGLPRD